MLDTTIGIKKETSQAFLADGTRIPVTKIITSPCLVTQIKTRAQDGYLAVQLGLGSRKPDRTSKPLAKHLEKALKTRKTNLLPRFLTEVRLDKLPEIEVGEEIRVNEVLKVGDRVNITGKSKGKGFTGVMKRWGFKGGPRTHGQSDRGRAPGSIGQTTTPGRVFKGKRMAGRGGGARVTIRNLVVVKVTAEGEVWVKGQVPGSRNGLVKIKKVGEAKKFMGLYAGKLITKAEKSLEKEKQAKVRAPVEESEPQAKK